MVFYDSWSIQTGDGIIDKMNQALAACELVLFILSKNSLQSNMAKLEWQNAVMKMASGARKIIPVKLDDCLKPPILHQRLYVDIFGLGLEVALRQFVDVSQGRNTFASGPQQFSNLHAYAFTEGAATIISVVPSTTWSRYPTFCSWLTTLSPNSPFSISRGRCATWGSKRA